MRRGEGDRLMARSRPFIAKRRQAGSTITLIAAAPSAGSTAADAAVGPQAVLNDARRRGGWRRSSRRPIDAASTRTRRGNVRAGMIAPSASGRRAKAYGCLFCDQAGSVEPEKGKQRPERALGKG